MKLQLCSATFVLGMVMSQGFAQPALDPAGTWLTEDGRAKIRTEKCGDTADKLCGYVVWMKEPLNDKGQPRTDIKNPDPAKRSRPSLGLELMTELVPEDPTHFSGEIYNAEDGKKYQVTLAIEKAAELTVRGCLLHFLCGSQIWTRVTDIALPAATGKAATVTPTKLVSTKAAKPAGAAPRHDTSPPAKTPEE